MWGTLSLLRLKGALLKMGVAQNPVGVAYHNNEINHMKNRIVRVVYIYNGTLYVPVYMMTIA